MAKNIQNQTFVRRYRCLLITGLIILVGSLFLSLKCSPIQTPVISIQDGQIQGVVEYSRNGSEYWSFKGIPYAHPPVGKLRFTPPLPNQKWKGVLQATNFSPFCKQFDIVIFHRVEGSLDCLYVNVFVGHPTTQNITRPVLIFIHGGGYMSGTSSYYYPDYFMDHDIILVTFNYRLGPFGFLNLEDEHQDKVPLPRGNMGLKDQLLALKWVQANIPLLGGDPDRVTIFGQSAGASSVHAHILSPQSHGLFHRAIAHSGSMFCPWSFSTKSRNFSTQFVKRLGCPWDDRKKMLTCLQNYDPDEMVKHQLSLTDPRLEKDWLLPSIESFSADDAFFLENPAELARNGDFLKVPLLMGVNPGEGAVVNARFDAISDPDLISQYDYNWTQLLGSTLGFDNAIPYNLSKEIRRHYFGNMSFTDDPTLFKRTFAKMVSHAAMYEPVNIAAMLHAKHGSPTYMYFYNYRSKFLPGTYSAYRAVGPNDWLPPKLKIWLAVITDWVDEFLLNGNGAHEYGVVHGEELSMLFNMNGESRTWSYWDKEFSNLLVSTIVDFVYGSPSFSYRGTEWFPINVSAVDAGEIIKYMLLDNSKEEGKMISEPFTNDITFWRKIGIEIFN